MICRRYAADELRRLAAAPYCSDLFDRPICRFARFFSPDYAAEREPRFGCECVNETYAYTENGPADEP